MKQTLTAIPFEGLNTDCLGNYLAGLGLMVALSQRWPTLRGCWRRGRFVICSEQESADEATIKTFLQKEWKPTEYERSWGTTQKSDTKAKSSVGIWRERSQRPLIEIRIMDAHIVGTGRNRFNPVLGTGGNVGKRDLAKAFADARKLLSKPASESWLDATLNGTCSVELPDLNNGGTWFVYANKSFNSGQNWYREGKLSPWSQLLATEGAFLLVGGVNRRLGSRARPYAVFPFISEPSSPDTDGEIGATKAEFWAPLWGYPATLAEIRVLFQRGLAKLGGRPAQAPHEFAVAALAAGVDGGIEEFARFELRRTTSSQVYEAIPRQRVRVMQLSSKPDDSKSLVTAGTSISISSLLVELIESGWMDRMPFEPHDSKQRGKFVGLRGPIERAILTLAERPTEPEHWQQLLLQLAVAQGRIDRSKQLRERCIPLPPLSERWFDQALPEPPIEIEVARAIASVGWFPKSNSKRFSSIPILSNVFGVEFSSRTKGWKCTLPKTRPAQAVWSPRSPMQNLLDVAHRRLINAETFSRTPFAGTRPVPSALIQSFLGEEMDLDEVAKWIPPLSLIDWSRTRPNLHHRSRHQFPDDGTAMLHALVRPLFHIDGDNKGNCLIDGKELSKDQVPKPNLLRRLFQLLRFGAIDEVIQVARNRYLAIGTSIVMPASKFIADGERVASALLIPMRGDEVAKGLQRWIQPAKQTSN